MSNWKLHPDSKAFLEELAGLNLPPSNGVTAEAVRTRFQRICRHFAGPLMEMARVEHPDSPVPARLYVPPGADESRVLLWFHGGRMICGGLETHDAACRLLAASTGWPVVAFDYRLAPEHLFPAALDDAHAAVQWAKSRFSLIAAGGDSAGASLALDAALQLPGTLAALVLFYPMIDATLSLPSHTEFKSGPGTSSDDVRMGYELWLPASHDKTDPRVSPLFANNLSLLPPCWILTAEIDPLRDEGQRIAQLIQAAGVPVDHQCVEGHIHGFLAYPGRFPAAHRAAAGVSDFVRRSIER